MGCDIHAYAERKTVDGYEHIKHNPFDCRSYGLFGFLADVRNYSGVKPIAELRGFPSDASDFVKERKEIWDCNGHSFSWLTMDELENFDYDQMTEDRRCTIGNDGGCTAPEGDGKAMTYREFLGEWYFDEIKDLKFFGADRVVFWFDN